ncbi:MULTISPECIES: amino acid adenylation domain-containing protein [unclassified Streptomyces]|uniref:non-ribosomal peptide synthetase n=1 Tax=unclassified Streptomyces TaxID=2593676 RepID=UPI0036E89F07
MNGSATAPWLGARFERAVGRHPGRTALVAEGRTLTFAELEEASRRVAAGLRADGVGTESLVGLHFTRSADLVVALLGVLRAGAAYVPLALSHPDSLLAFMIENSAARLVLTDGDPAGVPAPRDVTVCRTDDLPEAPFTTLDLPAPHRHQLAYVIYTSGSTGRPKGVEVTYGSLEALLTALERTVYDTGPAVCVGWNASPSFDASVQQWLRLFRGDTVILIDERTRTEPEALVRLIVEQRMSELDISPAHLLLLLDPLEAADLARPLRLLIGGEQIGEALWKRLGVLAESGRVSSVNLYGPTECTVDVTAALIDGAEPPHLGAPLGHARLQVLDDLLRPADEGEIYVSGDGLARGYRGRPGLTAERFVASTVDGGGRRMYRTGDLVRRRGGRLEYLGRSDFQVKLRGYRIETGEVEAVLERCPGVGRAVVQLEHDPSGEPALVAYCQSSADLSAADLRAAAGRQLPAYMVPSVFVLVGRLPLTDHGKVDRAGLSVLRATPEPVASPQDGPLSETEQVVAAVWSHLLDVEHVGPDDDFFTIGGQSALAIQLASRLRRVLGRAVPMVAVFENPTLRGLSTYLDQGRGKD